MENYASFKISGLKTSNKHTLFENFRPLILHPLIITVFLCNRKMQIPVRSQEQRYENNVLLVFNDDLIFPFQLSQVTNIYYFLLCQFDSRIYFPIACMSKYIPSTYIYIYIPKECLLQNKLSQFIMEGSYKLPLAKGRKLNVQKTFGRRLRRILNALCTFNLRPMSRG